MEYGYARVSSRDQKLDRQLDALIAQGIAPERIFADKASGKDFDRPAYGRLMGRIGPEDVIFIPSIDRLGRNYEEIIDQWRSITREKGAHIVVLDMPILDTRQESGGITGVFICDLMLQLLSYVAQIEREHIRQRQAEGIAAAKARGVSFGRPRIPRPSHYEWVKRAWMAGELTRREAAAELEVSPGTFINWLRRDEQDGSQPR